MSIDRRLIVAFVLVLFVAGCGAHRMSPVEPRGAGSLKPDIEDSDAGLVGMAPGFNPKTYPVIVVLPFKVEQGEIKDAEDARLAKDMSAYVHAQLLRKLQAAGIFTKVLDATTTAAPEGKILQLQGEITRLTEGSQAMRYFVGFGAGAAKAQVEARVVDASSGQIQLITADRRAAGMGIFGGDGRQFVTESLDQITDGLVKLLQHLSSGGQPGRR